MNRFTRVLFSILLCSLIIAVPSIWAMWIEDGVPVCMATDFQVDTQITSDGAGGSIITWADRRSGEYDIYAQRIDASGTALWTTDGVLLCTDFGEDEEAPRITSDGAGGAIVVWQDYRSGTSWDVYAQRIDSAGTVLWDEYGIEVCTVSLDQDQPRIVSDDAGGAIIVW
ncbi:MAG: hypothetical protein KOO63_15540, partial [Bacteroidales bacterium]|nr:hypothetical protein [Candidatus Latescibacterota bacterium]